MVGSFIVGGTLIRCVLHCSVCENLISFGNFWFTSSNWNINPQKQPKPFVEWKVVRWLFCFTAYQPFSVLLRPNWILNNSVKKKYRFLKKQLNVKTVLFQTIEFSISTEFHCQNSSISNNSVLNKYRVSLSKTVLFPTIQLINWIVDNWISR